MVMCWAPGCSHYNEKDECRFFRFPKADIIHYVAFYSVILTYFRRDVEPGPGSFLCSCHFVDQKRENGPTIFKHNVEKRLTFESPEKKKRAKASTKQQMESTTSTIAMEISTDELEPQPGTSTHVEDTRSTTGPSIVELQVANYFLQAKVDGLEKILQNGVRLTYGHINSSDDLINVYTGLPTRNIFDALYNLLKDNEINYYLKWNVDAISKEDQLLLCLMKLRQNFPHIDLAHRFQISQATVTNIVITWIHVLHDILYKQLMSSVPSRNKNKTCLPNAFSTFTNCRIVLDCTEMATVTSRTSMSVQKATFSTYKHRNTWKALVGVAPNGVITYSSDLYPGSTSDKKIVQSSGVLNLMEKGDLILADKGFLIQDIVPSGVSVNIPPFLMTPQFTPDQVHETEKIARARIHVERAIQRIKSYKILSFMPYKLLRHADATFQTIVALTNLKNPLIKEVEGHYSDESE